MNITRALHETAMEYADRAVVAKLQGEGNKAELEYLHKAFELEREAALQMPIDAADPVPRFILLRSTAALAYKSGLFSEAEKFIQLCVAENPPDFILQELREIQEAIANDQHATGQRSFLNIEGVLIDINSRENEIFLEASDHSQTPVLVVSRQKLSDIIQKYWAKKVTVQARQTPHGIMVLEKISAAA